MEFTISQIASLIKGSVKGDGSVRINRLAKIQEAKSGHVTFFSNPKYENYLYTTQAGAVILDKKYVLKQEISPALILVDDPYSAFTLLIDEYYRMVCFNKEGVEEPCYIGKETTVGNRIYRGAFSYIGSHVKIGDNVKIYPQVFIGDNVVIGNNVILYPQVKVYRDTRIGNDCVLHAGAVIGSDGFGFAPQADGTYKTIPQLGNVILEDQVSIGTNTVIDCSTLPGDSTIIRKGAKIDNLIQIAHNVEVGKNTVIAALSGIAGSSKVGDNCQIGGQVGISGHLTIADHTRIAAQSGVAKSIETPGLQWLGSPVIDLKQFFRCFSVFKQLPDLEARLHHLENKLKSQNS